MILAIAVPIVAFTGMMAYFIIQQILVWSWEEKSTFSDLLLSNAYTPICMFVYIILIKAMQSNIDILHKAFF